jgi:hypothetical protein
MAKEVIKSSTAVFTTRYRAFCTKLDYKGNWRATRAEAVRDALNHQNEKPHKVDIEVEQTQRIRAEMGEG